MDHLKNFFNRSGVRPLAVSTQSPDDRISSEHPSPREEEKREEKFHWACMGTSIMVVLPLFIDFGNVKLS